MRRGAGRARCVLHEVRGTARSKRRRGCGDTVLYKMRRGGPFYNKVLHEVWRGSRHRCRPVDFGAGRSAKSRGSRTRGSLIGTNRPTKPNLRSHACCAGTQGSSPGRSGRYCRPDPRRDRLYSPPRARKSAGPQDREKGRKTPSKLCRGLENSGIKWTSRFILGCWPPKESGRDASRGKCAGSILRQRRPEQRVF